MRRKIMGIYCFFGAVSKTVIQVTVSRVRIPVFPQPSLDFNQLQAMGTELWTKGIALSPFFC